MSQNMGKVQYGCSHSRTTVQSTPRRAARQQPSGLVHSGEKVSEMAGRMLGMTRFLLSKQSTGLVGVSVNPAARSDLIGAGCLCFYVTAPPSATDFRIALFPLRTHPTHRTCTGQTLPTPHRYAHACQGWVPYAGVWFRGEAYGGGCACKWGKQRANAATAPQQLSPTRAPQACTSRRWQPRLRSQTCRTAVASRRRRRRGCRCWSLMCAANPHGSPTYCPAQPRHVHAHVVS
jgi:hypothetical protein